MAIGFKQRFSTKPPGINLTLTLGVMLLALLLFVSTTLLLRRQAPQEAIPSPTASPESK